MNNGNIQLGELKFYYICVDFKCRDFKLLSEHRSEQRAEQGFDHFVNCIIISAVHYLLLSTSFYQLHYQSLSLKIKMLHNFFRPSFLVKSRTVIIPFYNIFFTCCPNWTQACNHIIGYIPGPIGSLFAIAPTQILEWHFCHPFMHLGILYLVERRSKGKSQCQTLN